MNTKELLLCVLMGGPATGYDIKKTLEQDVSMIVDVSINNIYPALNELAIEGLVTFERVEQEGRPNKKVYEITDKGREVGINALMKCEARHRLRSDFLFVLTYAPYLPRGRISELLDQRLAEATETVRMLDDLERDGPKRQMPGEIFAIGLGRALLQAERDYILKNRDALLARIPEQAQVKPGPSGTSA